MKKKETIRQQKTARVKMLISRPQSILSRRLIHSPVCADKIGFLKHSEKRMQRVTKGHSVDWALPLSMEMDLKSALPSSFLSCHGLRTKQFVLLQFI